MTPECRLLCFDVYISQILLLNDLLQQFIILFTCTESGAFNLMCREKNPIFSFVNFIGIHNISLSNCRINVDGTECLTSYVRSSGVRVETHERVGELE